MGVESLVIGICLLLNIFAVKVLKPPLYPYNVDSALKYIIFFAMGYISMPCIKELFKYNSFKKRFVIGVTGIIAFIFAVLNFFVRDIFSTLGDVWGIGYLYFNIISPIALSWFILIISYILEKVQIFNILGQESLYLCGNEMVIKEILKILIILLIGNEVDVGTPLTAYIYTIILMAATHYFLIPFEINIVKAVCKQVKISI